MYSHAPYALYIVPICGAWAGGVWQLVALIVGVRELHGINGWRATIAVLWPMATLLAVYFGLIALLFTGRIH
jgi:hypothetical protein